MEFLQAGGTVDGGWSGRKLVAGLKSSAMAYQLTLASICFTQRLYMLAGCKYQEPMRDAG